MTEFNINKNAPIFIEVDLTQVQPKAPGVEQTAIKPAETVKKLFHEGAKALDNSMNTIYNMALRMKATIDAVDEDKRPSTFEVEFGIDFDGELNAGIAKGGVGASIVVKMTWEK